MQHIEMFYTYLMSQQTAQHYLYNCYKRIEGVDAERKSYENCTVFISYLEHGQLFYQSGKNSSPILQPVLYFYGMAHLIKACLLTVRPDYPESTTLLAHGVTARKRKKKDYSFLHDEVKLQHNGLFPYFSEHLFKVSKLPFEKLSMKQLLSLIPEMVPLLGFHQEKGLYQVGKTHGKWLEFPLKILDDYYTTKDGFVKKISSYLPDIKHMESDSQHIQIELAMPLTELKGPFFSDKTQTAIFFPAKRDLFLPFSEIMVHYLLLYNLSMLCRYETDWWGDLFTAKSDIDYPFITQFLKESANKVPLLLGLELYKKKE
ncbi:YaaC family protein [Oceanobacillus manasiensis]|uniref:YaaC family protein n=1 Tax=Oceanobacillus manasiensis TaxID=586413 RepID=UPI0005AA7AC9|nr:YaaC family protein [Oceanobacillus manasiensis]